MNVPQINLARRPDTGGGFSLVELVAVMAITAILAAVAIPTLTNLASTRAASAANLLVRDLSYARERAITTGRRTWAVFDVAQNRYSLLQEPIGNPGRANAVAMNDPAYQRNFVQTLGTGEFSGVSIASASFDAAAEVGYDWLGKPLNSTQAPLATNGTVTLSGGRTVTVQLGTGLVTTP